MAQKYRVPSDYQNDVSRATHSWSSGSDGTIHPGLAYPVHHRHLNIGDRIRGSFNELIQSESMQGPLLNGFKFVTIATFTPDSVIYGWLCHGHRYSPKEYQDFTRWSFCPYDYDGLGDVNYASPIPNMGHPVSVRLSAGLPYDGANESAITATAYQNWISDLPTEKNPRNSHVGRGGLWDWLGLPAGAVPPCSLNSGGDPELMPSWNLRIESAVAYFLSIYYYLANMQDDNMYFTRSAYDLISFENTLDSLSNVPFEVLFNAVDTNSMLSAFDYLRFNSVRGTIPAEIFSIGDDSGLSVLTPLLVWLSHGAGAHGGLFAVPYSPDFFNNIIKLGDAPSVDIPVTTTDDGSAIAVPNLRLQNQIQNMLDRLFVSGGRPGDMFRTLWGKKSSPYIDKPEFLGVWQTGINPSNVVASAVGVNGDDSSSVGQMAARVDRFADFSKGQQIDYYAKEPGTVLFISFLVPEPSYAQGLHPDLFADGFAGDFNPELKGLGFTSVPRWRYSMMPNTLDPENSAFYYNPADKRQKSDPNMTVVGDTVHWDWLRTDYRRLHGEFAQNGVFGYWVLKRSFTEVYSFQTDDGMQYSMADDFYTYVNPLAWQYLFVGQTLLDPNFMLVSNFNLKVTSSVPSTYMPYLGR